MRLWCIDCPARATHRGRCQEHYQAFKDGPAMRERSRRQATIAAGSNAAARKRAEIRKAGWVRCAHCPLTILPSAVDVDHIRPIAFGGEDVDGNIQVLCRPCHKAKTRSEFGHRTTPF